MAARALGHAVPETGKDGAYCAFKDDQARLLALVSRDVRLVLIALVLAFALPAASGLVVRAVTFVLKVL